MFDKEISSMREKRQGFGQEEVRRSLKEVQWSLKEVQRRSPKQFEQFEEVNLAHLHSGPWEPQRNRLHIGRLKRINGIPINRANFMGAEPNLGGCQEAVLGGIVKQTKELKNRPEVCLKNGLENRKTKAGNLANVFNVLRSNYGSSGSCGLPNPPNLR